MCIAEILKARRGCMDTYQDLEGIHCKWQAKLEHVQWFSPCNNKGIESQNNETWKRIFQNNKTGKGRGEGTRMKEGKELMIFWLGLKRGDRLNLEKKRERKKERKRERERERKKKKDSHCVKILWQWSVNIHPIHRFSLLFGETIDPVRCFRECWRGKKRRGYPIQVKESRIKSGWILLNPISVQNYPGVQIQSFYYTVEQRS